MENKEIHLDNYLAMRLKKRIKELYGNQSVFAHLFNIDLDKLRDSWNTRTMSVKQLCFILYELSLTEYSLGKIKWEEKNSKEKLKKTGKPLNKIEEELKIKNDNLSKNYYQGYLAPGTIKKLEEAGYYEKYSFPKNPECWHKFEICEKIQKVFDIELEKLTENEMRILQKNLMIYMEISDVYWRFICSVQFLDELDIKNLMDAIHYITKHHSSISTVFSKQLEIQLQEDCKSKEEMIADCHLFFKENYLDPMERYKAIARILPKLPYILYLDTGDWKLLNEFSQLVDYDLRYPYKFPIMFLKMIDGIIMDKNKSQYYLRDIY